MRSVNRLLVGTVLVLMVVVSVSMLAQGPAQGQAPAAGQGQGRGAGAQGRGAPGGGGPGGAGGRGGPAAVLPEVPTAVKLPAVTGPITGPGVMYQSVQSLAPGGDLAKFKYEEKEYFISGTAQGQPYKTRIVVRKPASNSKFSGLVLLEAMHPSGSAHMFEFSAIYSMSNGHAAVEIQPSGGLNVVTGSNAERYKDFAAAGNQTNEIIAQVGALVKSKDKSSPFAGLNVRKIVLGGTSATAATLNAYLPAHMIYRTPDMQRIYDGFFPTSAASVARQVDVPVVLVPTMREVQTAQITTRPDGDAPGDQFRVYEFPGMGHVDSRDNVRLLPNPCVNSLSTFPAQAYMSVALNYLYQWVDKGIAPPKAERVVKEGNNVVLDERGNWKGGIRTPYVDVPAAKYAAPNRGANPLPAKTSDYVTRGGVQAAEQMCGLSSYQVDFTKEDLKKIYGDKKAFKSKYEKRLAELQKAGWSLPVYKDMILSDAARIDF
jgi:alpha/beta hydrolase family protein